MQSTLFIIQTKGLQPEMNPTDRPDKPHAVCIPYPAQGHVTPMLKLAKLLHHTGFHITFVNTEYNHKRLLRSQGSAALDGLPDFRFESIPDGLPPSDNVDVTQDIPALCDSVRKNCLGPFRHLLAKLNDQFNVPRVTCIVSDGVMSFTVDAAEEAGLPIVFFWTTAACALLAHNQYHNLLERGLIPLKDESCLTNGYLEETTIDWIPGMKEMRLKDLPSFVRTTDRNYLMLDVVIGEVGNAPRASAIILNTYYELEHDALDALSSIYQKVISIGPLQLLLDQIPQNPKLESIGANLWKVKSECLDWLDSKPPSSVVYVNFGSITVMTSQQLVEIAWGLANSKQTFLWIIRPDIVAGDSAILPTEFLVETEGRSLLASWCPQERVLNHPSIGGFLTHCGWNSTLESISSGVPMLCWPFFSDQPTNRRYACVEWGIGIEIDTNVKKEEIEKLVRELIEGEHGKEMKKNALEWKKKSVEATTNPNGSSCVNFDKLVELLKQ